MFFVVNKTKGTVVISDINITLGPRQAMDLDKMMNRSKSESSKMLKLASHKGQIDIRIKDGGKSTNLFAPVSVNNGLDELKNDILNEMKDILSKQSQPVSPSGLDKKDLAEFAQQIIQNMPKQETAIAQGQVQDIRSDEEVLINEDLLADINARAVDSIVEGADTKSISYKEETQQDDLMQNIQELEDMIG